jgi:DNA repair exonuclease SbcCD nuclease subunit
MKVAIITDTHWSARKSSKIFQDYFEIFYKNIFFPTLEEHGITTVIHMGDAFDSRKSIDFSGLDWTQRVVLNPLSKYQVHMITGNHDTFYKSSNKINSPDLLLQSYTNIKTYSEPTEVTIGKLPILFLPWINSENEKKSIKMIQNSKSKVAMGHLELQGFHANKDILIDHGMDSKIFDNFDRVFSGHYHTRSTNGKIFYLGNPYEIYWTDVNDTRGFHLFDTETLELTEINNPYQMFHIIYYEDTDVRKIDFSQYENKIVKLIIRKRSDSKQFEKFLDKLYESNISDLKIIENFQVQESETFEQFENEDTLSILNRYIEDSEIKLEKTKVQQILQQLYQEACDLV